MRTDQLTAILENLFGELMHGVSGRGGFMLNHRDRGLLRSLERVPASEASALTRTGSSIAAHVAHLAYGLSLMNRWGQGENPFGNADWAAAWKKTSVTEPEWEALRIQLRDQAARGAGRRVERHDRQHRAPGVSRGRDPPDQRQRARAGRERALIYPARPF